MSMVAGLETLLSFDWSTLVSIIGWLGTIGGITVAVIKTLKEKGLAAAAKKLTEEVAAKGKEIVAIKNFFSSDVPLDDEQKEIAVQKDIQKAWRMPENNFNVMWDILYNQRKLEIRKEDLRKAVDDAEADLQPEYAIVMRTPKGEVDREATHVYVTYGFSEYHMDYDNLMQKWRDTNCEKVYYVTEHWHLSKKEINKMMANIGDRPQCIANLTNTIENYESKEAERYAIECGDRWWIVERGKVVQAGAGGVINDHIEREAENDNDTEQ